MTEISLDLPVAPKTRSIAHSLPRHQDRERLPRVRFSCERYNLIRRQPILRQAVA